MPFFDHKMEEISKVTESGPVPSQETLMSTSLLGSGDRSRSNSIMARGDSPVSSSLAKRSVQKVCRGTHS